jgi:hypothetical protein
MIHVDVHMRSNESRIESAAAAKHAVCRHEKNKNLNTATLKQAAIRDTKLKPELNRNAHL